MPEQLNGAVVVQRAEAIRLPLNAVAAVAGLNKHTLSNLKRGRDVRMSTITRALEAVVAEELRLRDRLNALHPPGKDAA